MNQAFEFLKHQPANVWRLYLMINDLNDESMISPSSTSVENIL